MLGLLFISGESKPSNGQVEQSRSDASASKLCRPSPDEEQDRYRAGGLRLRHNLDYVPIQYRKPIFSNVVKDQIYVDALRDFYELVFSIDLDISLLRFQRATPTRLFVNADIEPLLPDLSRLLAETSTIPPEFVENDGTLVRVKDAVTVLRYLRLAAERELDLLTSRSTFADQRAVTAVMSSLSRKAPRYLTIIRNMNDAESILKPALENTLVNFPECLPEVVFHSSHEALMNSIDQNEPRFGRDQIAMYYDAKRHKIHCSPDFALSFIVLFAHELGHATNFLTGRIEAMTNFPNNLSDDLISALEEGVAYLGQSVILNQFARANPDVAEAVLVSRDCAELASSPWHRAGYRFAQELAASNGGNPVAALDHLEGIFKPGAAYDEVAQDIFARLRALYDEEVSALNIQVGTTPMNLLPGQIRGKVSMKFLLESEKGLRPLDLSAVKDRILVKQAKLRDVFIQLTGGPLRMELPNAE